MSKKITGNEYPLADVFSAKFSYSIPSYQRPYAWTTEETGSLFDDLLDFYRNEPEDNYFLGSIVLIKEETMPAAEVIDGQQRLTTLTILFAALAHQFITTAYRDGVKKYIREPGDPLEGRSPSPRLKLREKDQAFFEKYIQTDKTDGTDNIDALFSAATNNESQKHIQENCDLLIKKLRGAFDDENALLKFSQFLVTRCFLVSVSTPSQQSAFRVFSVMNSRGLDLLPIDIIKADILGKIPRTEQDAYTKKWEDLEEMTTRAGFNDLFGHIRMIFAKLKAKRTLLEEFKTQVLSLPSNAMPKDFVDDVLTPFADAYSTIKNQDFEATHNAEEINDLLGWLNKINNSDWIPVAVFFMAKNDDDPDYLLWFFTRLERLAAYLHIAAKDVNARIGRYAKVLSEIEQSPNSSLSSPLTSIELNDNEKTEFTSVLNGDIYYLTAIRRNYAILRLDSFVSNCAAKYDSSVLTIEHVLPQTVAPNSEWEQQWVNVSERERWLHKIANLVPLSRKHNSSAQNYDFDRKKKEYFIGKNGTSAYSLTTQVLATADWIPTVVENRQKKLLDDYKKGWDL